MARKRNSEVPETVLALARVLDAYEGRYRELKGASSFGEYVTVGVATKVADEETLTEPLLASLLEDVLGFGKGDYFPQLGKSGLKPDFTPIDLVTHRFVLDAKGSSESLTAHVAQIQRYVEQRGLRVSVVSGLLEEGRAKVERVERLVCALYGVPDDLTDAVVQHAVDRAAR